MWMQTYTIKLRSTTVQTYVLPPMLTLNKAFAASIKHRSDAPQSDRNGLVLTAYAAGQVNISHIGGVSVEIPPSK